MKKTISIQISGILFHIDDDAYGKLDHYLKSIHAHFKKNADGEEIVADIESRIAEQFNEKLKKGKHKEVITLHDVDALIKNMGTIEDFETFEEEEGTKQSFSWENPSFANRGRLYRDADDQILGGVCSGLAKYFGIDPVITRLAFGLSLFLGGFGVILYILLWIILPEARTTAEKVEMTGGKLTLSAIQQRIDAAMPKDQRDSILRKIVAVPLMIVMSILRFLGKIVRIIVPLFARIIGFAGMMAAAFAIAALTLVLFALLINPESPYIGFPIRDVLGAVTYIVVLVSGYFLVFIPLVFALMFGVSLLLLKRSMTATGVVTLVVMWFVALPVFGAALFDKGPEIEAAAERYYEENFARTTRSFELKDFDSIDVGGITHVDVTYGEEYSVTLEAAERDHEYLNVVVKDATLMLERRRDNDYCLLFCFREGQTLTVTMPDLALLDLYGASSATVSGFEDLDAVTFIVNGHSSLDAALIADDIALDMDGASSATFSGSGGSVMIDADGIPRIDGSNFVVQTAEVDIDGAGRVILDVRAELNGTASGNSDILYLTEPPVLNVRTHGMSSVRQRDEARSYQWE